MVWIKLEDASYLNADLITSVHGQSRGSFRSIICQCGEFRGETDPSTFTLWSETLDRQYSRSYLEALIPFVLTGLEKAKENGDTILDLPEIIDSFEFEFKK